MSIPVEYVICKINILKKAVIAALAVLIVSLFFDRGFSLGFFMGGCVALANFSLLSKYILQMRELSIKKAQRFIVSKFLFMYLIMGAALFIGKTKGLETFLGVAAGLLIIKIAIFLDGLGRKECQLTK